MFGQAAQQRKLRRRLSRVHAELVAARQEMSVAEEQLAALVDDADEARVRSLVSDNRFDEQTSTMAERHREVMRRAVEHARHRVEELSTAELKLLSEIEV